MIPTLYEPFRHWSATGSVYILSDLHFDDDDCKLMDPNWIMPKEQIEIINSKVNKSDTFVCLGDVGKADYVAEKILLSHEPVYGLPWCLNIHGHDHSGMEDYREDCKYLNLAANVCGYTPVSLGKIIKDGILSDVPSIHRMTIDRAVEKKVQREMIKQNYTTSSMT